MSDKKHEIINSIEAINQQLDRHPIYSVLDSIPRIKAFVVYHSFDTRHRGKLIESIQNKIEPSSLPKSHRYHHELKRLIEETFFNRPDKLYPNCQSNRNFVSYLRTVSETDLEFDFYLWYFLEAPNNLTARETEIKALVKFNSTIARYGTIPEMIAVLFFGQKKLDLRIFIEIVRFLDKEGKECLFLPEYIENLRQNQSSQSELLAFRLINYFCQHEAEEVRALQTGLKMLRLRKQLWDRALSEIRNIDNSTIDFL